MQVITLSFAYLSTINRLNILFYYDYEERGEKKGDEER